MSSFKIYCNNNLLHWDTSAAFSRVKSFNMRIILNMAQSFSKQKHSWVFLLVQPICCLVNYNVQRLNLSTIRCFQGSEQICICRLWPQCRASFPLNCWLRAALCVHTCACALVSACVCVVLCVFVACTLSAPRLNAQCKQGRGSRRVHLLPGSFVLLHNVLLYANMPCIWFKTHLYLLPKEMF